MASARLQRDYQLTSNNFSEALRNDEDSDVDEVASDGEIDVSDYCTVQLDEDDVESTPMDVLGSAPERGVHTRERVQRVARSRRVRRSRQPRSHSHSSLERSSHTTRNLREMDEAIGWTYTAREQPPVRPIFEQANKVLSPNINETSSELDCFLVFFPESFWKLLKTETNRYASEMKAKQAMQGQQKVGSMLYNWRPVTILELKKFICIIIHMSLVQKETLDSYWSTREIIHTPFASKVMKRARFRAIYSCLHLNDNSKYKPRGHPDYDAIFKLRPYFDELCRLCEDSYYPNEELTIDEGICAYRGRVPFRVFNKDKPDKYGMKIYMLCDAETGYVLRMVPYVGDSKPVLQIVTELVEPYFNKWHTIYMDRAFTRCTVADLFWDRKTRVVGTVMPDHSDLPQEWLQQPLDTDEMAFCHRENMTACKWKDKRDVFLLTTKHAASCTKVTVKAKGRPPKIKPDCVLDYNIHKIGVLLNDQYVSSYTFYSKSMKWWKKMFFHLVARAMVNAYILYNKSRSSKGRKLKFSQFLNTCGEALLENIGTSSGAAETSGQSRGPHPTGKSTRLEGRHFHRRIPSTATKKNVTRVCKVCADTIKKQTGKRGRKETSFYCKDCNIPLCHYPCFEKYHTQKEYTI